MPSPSSTSSSSTRSRTNAPVLPPLKFSLSTRPDPFSLTSSKPSDPFSSSHSHSQPLDSFSTSTSIFHRPLSPTRVQLTSTPSASVPSFRLSLQNRPLSPTSRVSVRDQHRHPHHHHHHHHVRQVPTTKRTCMCSPTSHPGSFRCAMHRNNNNTNNNNNGNRFSCSPSRLNLRRSAMTNSLVRIGTVEGDWVKRALTALIRPSSHQQRRRWDFQPRPSRLSVMSKAQDCGV